MAQKHLELIDEASEKTGAKDVYALVSGGHDSLAMLSVAIEHPNFRGAVHINTGVGVEATREHVRQTCSDMKCPLLEYCAVDNKRADGTPDPQIYEELVLEQGFPGPTKFGHGKMYNRLKERPLRMLAREQGITAKSPAIFCTGVRSKESQRRMGFVETIQHGEIQGGKRVNKGRVWVALIHDWEKEDCRKRIEETPGMSLNPVAKELCKSGECYCGGFGTEGELEELTAHDFSRAFGYWMLDLQGRVAEKHGWKWHERKPKWATDKRRGQEFLFDMGPGAMCWSCNTEHHES